MTRMTMQPFRSGCILKLNVEKEFGYSIEKRQNLENEVKQSTKLSYFLLK